MKITDLINENLICLDLQSTTKKSVIVELATLLLKEGRISELPGFIQEIEAREELGSTGFGYSTAIPHAKTSFVLQPSLVFAKSKEGLDYESLDGEPTYLFFMIAAPGEGANLHLQILAKLSRNLIYDEFRDALQKASTKEEVLAILKNIDKGDQN